MYSLKNRIAVFLILSLSALLLGCAEMKTLSREQAPQIGSKIEINERCELDIPEIEIFQVLGETGALANVCKDPSDYCMGMVVAVPSNGELFWDKKRIKASQDKCIVVNGTYEYTANNGLEKTVPIIGFAYKYPAADEKEAEERMEAGLSLLNERCLAESMKESGANRIKNVEMCRCYVDQLGSLSKEAGAISEDENDEVFINKWIIQSKKECGKSPKKMKWF